MVRGLALAFLGAAAARSASIRQVGRPHPVFLGLLGAEVVVGTGLLKLQADVDRA